ncbi:hypothetical protein [Lentibacillus juripiscarius]|uniref:Uncharacterized protein n=1 Tax=Lentibacillus juripiscarius TaxID=257446 RepID=A0ABW5V714_9BACI
MDGKEFIVWGVFTYDGKAAGNAGANTRDAERGIPIAAGLLASFFFGGNVAILGNLINFNVLPKEVSLFKRVKGVAQR